MATTKKPTTKTLAQSRRTDRPIYSFCLSQAEVEAADHLALLEDRSRSSMAGRLFLHELGVRAADPSARKETVALAKKLGVR
jgi:hypothetical protein